MDRVVLIIVDTLRADATAPELEAFAAQSAVFTNAAALSSWTRPTVSTMFTGLSPDEHLNGYLFSRLSEQAVTVAERYREAGWSAWGAFGNNILAGPLGQGFEPWSDYSAAPLQPSRSEELVRSVREQFGSKELVYVHLIGPHEPYTPSPTSAATTGADLSSDFYAMQARGELDDGARLEPDQLAELRALYEAEVLDELALLGPLLQDPVLDDALVILSSDHGQALGANEQLTHGGGPWAAQIHVPLMVRGPGVQPGVREELVSHLDIHSTLLAAAGLGEGRDLRCSLEPAAELHLLDFFPGPERGVSFRGRIEGQAKAIERPVGRPLLFEDWRQDGKGKRRFEDPRLEAMLSAPRPPVQPELSSVVEEGSTTEGLRALGYLP